LDWATSSLAVASFFDISLDLGHNPLHTHRGFQDPAL
jgi:hypothetical protein